LLGFGEQPLQPIQTDRVLADLRHQPEATAADNATPDSCGSAVPVRGLAKLFEVHAFTASEPA
jgi:hypothetical protein